MVLNYDQLWKSAYQSPKEVLAKRSSTAVDELGMETRPEFTKGKRLKAILAIVEKEMKGEAVLPPSKLRKNDARAEMVQGSRQSLTAITSVWGNGELGPLGICVAQKGLAQQFIKEFNKEWYGHAYIFESGTESHFMNADTTIQYFQELLGPATWLLARGCFWFRFFQILVHTVF